MTDMFRNLTGMVAALVLGTTLIAAALVPAATASAPSLMTATTVSNIITHA